jgi:hypothetical protein
MRVIGTKLFCTLLFCAMAFAGAGCPDRTSDDVSDKVFHVGTWEGNITTYAWLVKKARVDYWNAAWRVESSIKLDEYSDGTLQGTSDVNFFYWELYDPLIRQYDSIATGPWTKYAGFTLQLTGKLDEQGYKIDVVELPISMPDLRDPGGIIEFWDFLYPSTVSGQWPEGGVRVMEGQSVEPQGADLQTTMAEADYRDSSVSYVWSIHKL